MNTQASKLNAEADRWQGYLEKKSNAQLEDFTANAGSGNYTIFGKWYAEYYKAPVFIHSEWCHMYLSFCANRTGIGPDVIPYTASCGTSASWFKKRGRWHASGTYSPQTGDIVFFARDGKKPVHAGFVRYVEAGRVYTIEGNTTAAVRGKDDKLITNGGGVAKKSYAISSAYILGYGNPAYTGMEIDVLVSSVSKMIGIKSPALWQSGLEGQIKISDAFMRALAAKVCARGGKATTPETLYATLDSVLDLKADDYWFAVLSGAVTVSTSNLIDLFLRIYTVFSSVA
jgi:hypothetical protein